MLIKNITRVGENHPSDMQIVDGRIAHIGHDLAVQDDQVIDGTGLTAAPGFIDVHVHFREPGFTRKETIKTGSQAAAHGGYTTVVAMPNLDPVPDNINDLKQLLDKNRTDGVVHIEQFAPMTKALTTTDLVDFTALKQLGALGFSNDGKGVQDAQTMLHAMQGAAKVNAPIAAHIEDESLVNHGVINAGPTATKLGLPGISNESESSQLARDLQLAASTGVHYHACHISTRQSVELIRHAKAAGVNVTAEVSPHHLLLDDSMILRDDPMFKMNPPLRSPEDRNALIIGLLDGTLDMIATDHAPHTQAEKSGSMATAAFGIVGLETAFSLLHTHLVVPGIMPLTTLIDKMSGNPARAFHLNAGELSVGQVADITLLDLNKQTTIDPTTWYSKGTNSPFIGQTVTGMVHTTIVAGHIAYQTED
ncbi:dihydroorotase [Lacticaseibacillus saniviri]